MNSEGGHVSLENSGLLRVAHTPHDVIEIMLEQAESPRPRHEVRKAFQDWLIPRSGGSFIAGKILEKSLSDD